MRILFVCLGNICRSPAAEGVFRQMSPEMQTDSAGTAHWHVGDPPYEDMQVAAQARGYDLSDLRARQFTVDDFGVFDLIIAMDAANLRDIEVMRPQTALHPFDCLPTTRLNQAQIMCLTPITPATLMEHWI